MFKFVFDLATEPLGLPVEWYYEWIILLVIGEIAYQIAYDKVGTLYHGDFISGRVEGLFFRWICYEGRNIWSDLDRQIDFGTQNTSGLLVYAVL